MSHSMDMRDKQPTHFFILKGVMKDPYIQAEDTDIQRLLHLYRRHAMKAHILPPTIWSVVMKASMVRFCCLNRSSMGTIA